MEGLPINRKKNSLLHLRRRLRTCCVFSVWSMAPASRGQWSLLQDTSLCLHLRLFMVASLDGISCCLHVHYCSKEAASKSRDNVQIFSCLWLGDSFDYRRNRFQNGQIWKQLRHSNSRLVLDRRKTAIQWFAIMALADRNILGCCCLYTCLCVLLDVEVLYSESGNFCFSEELI